jgi:LCP family protein required for cell wall assembly
LSKVSILKSSSIRHFFWQTLFSIVLGVTAGFLIVTFTQRRPAEALSKSTLPFTQTTNNGGQLQILPMLSERMTVLVMGVDSNGRDAERFTSTRSDTMILVSLDPITRKVGIVSIPRDSRVKIAKSERMDKINAAHAFGGPELAVQTVSEDFSVPINHYVVVDTTALKDLCQLLGPVEVLVEKDMHYHDWAAHLHIDLKPGLQTLSPEQVEQYVRFRHDAKGDIGRIERQQWFFRAAAKKLRDPQFLLRLPDLIRMAHDYVRTDLSLEDMARIATFAKDVKPEEVVTATLPGAPEMINGGSYWVPDIDGCRSVFNRMLGLSSGGGFVMTANEQQPGTTSGDTTTVAVDTYKPPVVAIKFAKGSDQSAAALEQALTQAGYNVRYKWLMPTSECQHDQLVQISARADDSATTSMRKQIPQLAYFPIALQLETKPIVDFSIVISPQTEFGTVTGTAPAETTVPATARQ